MHNCKFDQLQSIFKRSILSIFAFTSLSMYSMDGPVTILPPNSYEMSRYGNTPVDLCHGIPSISIPLTSISDRNISVNVSLSYLASGIKVDQEATTVGLGWVLNAGGVITRTVRGIPDQFGYKGQWKQRSTLAFYNGGISVKEYGKQELNNMQDCVEGSSVTDPSPDIFSMNFCGRSGSFFLDEEAKGHFNSYQDLSVEYVKDQGDTATDGYFKITDENGNIYVFNNRENSRYDSKYLSLPVSWYLTSITSAAGEQISFTYLSDREYKKVTRYYDKCYIRDFNSSFTFSIDKPFDGPSFRTDWGNSNALLISSIRSSTGAAINFIYTAQERKDLFNSGHILSQIKQTSSNGTIIKNYVFSYDYFEATSKQRLEDSFRKPFLNYRLKLTGIQELSADGRLKLSPYKFVYYGDDGNYKHRLPYRLSPNQDYWGYYNGKANTSMFPGINDIIKSEPLFELIKSIDSSPVTIKHHYDAPITINNGADRNIDDEYVTAGTLKEIYYPTGGCTKFRFEANNDGESTSLNHFGRGGIRIKKIDEYVQDKLVQEKSYSYSSPKMEEFDGNTGLFHKIFVGRWTKIKGDYVEVWHDRYHYAYGIPPEYFKPVNGFKREPNAVIVIESNPVENYQIGNDFMYPQVTEYISGIGSNVYTYSYYRDVVPNGTSNSIFKDIYRIQYYEDDHLKYDPVIRAEYNFPSFAVFFPFPTRLDCSWMRGNLLSKKSLDSNGHIISEDTYSFQDTIIKTSKGFKAVPVKENDCNMGYIYTCDYLVSGLMRMTSHTHEEFPGVKTVTTYKYDDVYHTYPVEEKTSYSDGTTMSTHKYLPSAYGSRFKTLVDKHILSPIDIRQYNSGQLVLGEQHAYNEFGQELSLYKYFYKESNGNEVPFSKEHPFTFVKCLDIEYDSNHLPILERNVRSNESLAYIWSYSRQYPIAMLQNPDETDLKDAKKMNSELANKVNITENDWNTFEFKRMLWKCPLSIFKYKPGVGQTKAIMPDLTGKEYVYDEFQRLWKTYIIDKKGNRFLETQYKINIQNNSK